jgi:hypothetical protein
MMHEVKVNERTNLIDVLSYATDLVDEKIVRVVLNESTGMTKQQAVTYMMQLGINSLEIALAMDEMEQNGHNVASFGARGNFVFSAFEGVRH